MNFYENKYNKPRADNFRPEHVYGKIISLFTVKDPQY